MFHVILVKPAVTIEKYFPFCLLNIVCLYQNFLLEIYFQNNKFLTFQLVLKNKKKRLQ